MLSNHLILCCPLLLLPSIFPSIGVFSNELVLSLKWPKYCCFSFSISPSNEYLGLIFFRIYWFDLLAIQETQESESLPQFHNSKASIIQCSAFFMAQLSHLYMTTGKTITLTIWTFVSKVMSLLDNTLSRFVKVFLLRSKSLLISWLQSLWEVMLEPKKTKSLFPLFPLFLCWPWNGGIGCHDLLDVEFQASFFTLLFHPH